MKSLPRAVQSIVIGASVGGAVGMGVCGRVGESVGGGVGLSYVNALGAL